jgi:molybdopterin-guanine dinucleotide biosynthesis protein B
MKKHTPPLLGFAAASGTGKTTLLTKLIPLLKKPGLRIGVIKHSHHNFEIDKPGKDSYQLRKAGASPIMLISNKRRAMITEFDDISIPRLKDQLKFFDYTELDLILVEGFKAEEFPKIELHRPSLKETLIFPKDPNIIAIASDSEIKITTHNSKLSNEQILFLRMPPVLDLNNPIVIAGFVLNHFFKNKNN